MPPKPPAPRTSLFLAYCPDRIGPNIVDTRLRVRAQHFAEFKADMQAGRAEFGRAILPPPTSALLTTPNLFPAGVQPMGGSVLLLRYPSLEDAWARVKADVYWTAGVWDHERTVVETFCEPPPSGTVAGAEGGKEASGVGIE